ncbi:stage VI sporulation protein F [Halalkalibacillus halophilus]|uniref:stage VI sporulation protein F n=1 Tax=Halalkalibacillus halophilus TaxID=392827 RepID=UPI0004885466|nr:stage VI sporulation protein F [Halalkalibacillus halophilus]
MSRELQQLIFDHLQTKANIQPDEVIQIAQAVQNADFSDRRTVRSLVQQLSRLANRPMSKQKEDKLVDMIINNNQSLNYSTLQQIFKK